jgi:hypothetical protein
MDSSLASSLASPPAIGHDLPALGAQAYVPGGGHRVIWENHHR